MPQAALPHQTQTTANGAALDCRFDLAMSEEAQSTAAALRNKEAGLWVFGHPDIEASWREVVRSGYRCLEAQPPNLVAAREIAARVEAAIDSRVRDRRRDNLWQRWGMGILAVLLVTALALAWAIPASVVVVRLPVWVFLLGAAGGAASGLVSLRNPVDILRHGKLAVFSAATRFFLGAVTGAMLYLLFASGAIAITVGTDATLFHAFVALAGGYCERVLGQVAGQAVTLIGASAADLRDERS